MTKVRITVLPDGRTFEVERGLTLKECLASVGISVRGSCGDRGSCGECQVTIGGQTVTSCTYRVSDDISVDVPQRSLVPVGDALTGQLSHGMPVQSNGSLESLAIDVGTTTIATSLQRPGATPLVRVSFNPQVACGDDVISRIIYAEDNPSGVQELRQLALDVINAHIASFEAETRPAHGSPARVVIAGNTTMLWTLLGRDLSPVRLDVIPPELLRGVVTTAGTLGMRLSPQTTVSLMPQVSAFVGGDTVAGILATGLHGGSSVRLLIDLGTNGEIVLGNRDWMVACACSVGPAFEGGGITWGMPAVPGAITDVEYDRSLQCFRVSTLGKASPVGICGSGLISLLGASLMEGVVDRSGAITYSHPLIRTQASGGAARPQTVPVVNTPAGMICLSSSDIDNLIRAKAAVYAGISTLLRHVGLTIDDVGEVLVAGGFGSSLDVQRAVDIGLLPDIDRTRYRPVGNASLAGAALCASSSARWDEATEIAGRVTVVDLSQDRTFMDEYVAAMFLPHTDLWRFRSARTR